MEFGFDVAYRVRRIDDLRRRLAGMGYRVTPQRVAVLHALVNGESHPTADKIFEQVRRTSPRTSLATVYKTLDKLKDLGEVQELVLGSGRRHYDAVDPKSHPHVICIQCGKIEDVRFEGADDLALKATQSTGYKIIAERLEFSGVCRHCQLSAERIPVKTENHS